MYNLWSFFGRLTPKYHKTVFFYYFSSRLDPQSSQLHLFNPVFDLRRIRGIRYKSVGPISFPESLFIFIFLSETYSCCLVPLTTALSSFIVAGEHWMDFELAFGDSWRVVVCRLVLPFSMGKLLVEPNTHTIYRDGWNLFYSIPFTIIFDSSSKHANFFSSHLF